MTRHGITGVTRGAVPVHKQEVNMKWTRRWWRRWMESIAVSRNSYAYELLTPIDED